jgi:multiple antibiotic resistance protein
MLRGNVGDAKDSKPDGVDRQTSLTPLILFAASPGTITGVITIAVEHTKLKFPVFPCFPPQEMLVQYCS